jgi:hypothetical protein
MSIRSEIGDTLTILYGVGVLLVYLICMVVLANLLAGAVVCTIGTPFIVLHILSVTWYSILSALVVFVLVFHISKYIIRLSMYLLDILWCGECERYWYQPIGGMYTTYEGKKVRLL